MQGSALIVRTALGLFRIDTLTTDNYGVAIRAGILNDQVHQKRGFIDVRIDQRKRQFEVLGRPLCVPSIGEGPSQIVECRKLEHVIAKLLIDLECPLETILGLVKSAAIHSLS